MRGLIVEDRWNLVKNYRYVTVNDFLELFAAAGCSKLERLIGVLIHKKVVDNIKSYKLF